MLLQGRRALITGASSGIGRATALRLAREGAAVAVNYFSDREQQDAESVAELARQSGVNALAVRADVSSESDVVGMVERTAREFGGLDLLVNNAGIEKQKPLAEMDLATWNAILATNLTGAFLCLREAAKFMLQQRQGVIVNMSSVHEFIPWPGFAHYCASKGGLKLLMQTAAREFAPNHVRVLNIAPGAIATPINDFVLKDPSAKRAVEEEIPLGRFGDADEIAAAVAWAASDEAAYVTGTTIVVDGGMSTYPKFI